MEDTGKLTIHNSASIENKDTEEFTMLSSANLNDFCKRLLFVAFFIIVIATSIHSIACYNRSVINQRTKNTSHLNKSSSKKSNVYLRAHYFAKKKSA